MIYEVRSWYDFLCLLRPEVCLNGEKNSLFFTFQVNWGKSVWDECCLASLCSEFVYGEKTQETNLSSKQGSYKDQGN